MSVSSASSCDILRFGLMGHPVGHSLSPRMHEASFRALHLRAAYELFDVPPDQLKDKLNQLRDQGYAGLNVTVPHKQAVLPLMDEVDPSALRLGAVNTIRIDPDGKMTGFNTDASGFMADLSSEFGLLPFQKSILIVGCGGAGRALAIACVMAGCSHLALANRTVAKAEALKEEITKLTEGTSCPIKVPPFDNQSWIQASRKADLIVHCTTCGLGADDQSLLPGEAFHKGQYLYDIVYTSPITPTMKVARSAGAWVANGLGMLVRQGAASFRIWTGRDANISAMKMAVTR